MARVQGDGGVLTIRLLGRTEIRRLAKDLDFRPRKSFGQNFVHDANTVRRVVSASGVHRHDHVLEVGPGLGSLTLGLLDRGAHVTAVEIDPILARQLPLTIAEHSHNEINRLTVFNRDVLTLQPTDLENEPTALVANLPYNVAVPALLHLLSEFPSIRTVMVMVQAEVAERLAAEPGGKDYGVPSVKLRFFGNVRWYGMVSPTMFWPIPRVYSGLVRIDRYDSSPWPTDAGRVREDAAADVQGHEGRVVGHLRPEGAVGRRQYRRAHVQVGGQRNISGSAAAVGARVDGLHKRNGKWLAVFHQIPMPEPPKK